MVLAGIASQIGTPEIFRQIVYLPYGLPPHPVLAIVNKGVTIISTPNVRGRIWMKQPLSGAYYGNLI
jgi:hypothetical protein